MTLLILLIIFFASGFLLGFGDNGRGTASPYISTIAGLLWLGGIVLAFVSEDIKFGIISIFASFVIAAIAMPIGKAVVASMKH